MYHTRIIEKSAWIFIKDNRVLSTRSVNRNSFYFPGGKPEPGETSKEALIREIKEELTVSLILESILSVGLFEAQADSQPEGVIVKMYCYTANYTGTLLPSSEIAEIAWLSYQDKHKTSTVDHLIFDWLYENKLLR